MSYIRNTVGVPQEPSGRECAPADATLAPLCVEAHAMAGCDLGTCTGALVQHRRRFSKYRSRAYTRANCAPRVIGWTRKSSEHGRAVEKL